MAIPGTPEQSKRQNSSRSESPIILINGYNSGPPCPSCQCTTSANFKLAHDGRILRSFRCPECVVGAVAMVEIYQGLKRNPRVAASRRLLEYGIGVSGRRVANLIGAGAPVGSYRVYKPANHLAIIEQVGSDTRSIEALHDYISDMMPSPDIPITAEVDESRSWIIVVDEGTFPMYTVLHRDQRSTAIQIEEQNDGITSKKV